MTLKIPVFSPSSRPPHLQMRRVDGPHVVGVDVKQTDGLDVELDGRAQVLGAPRLPLAARVAEGDAARVHLHQLGGHLHVHVRLHHAPPLVVLVLLVVRLDARVLARVPARVPSIRVPGKSDTKGAIQIKLAIHLSIYYRDVIWDFFYAKYDHF